MQTEKGIIIYNVKIVKKNDKNVLFFVKNFLCIVDKNCQISYNNYNGAISGLKSVLLSKNMN